MGTFFGDILPTHTNSTSSLQDQLLFTPLREQWCIANVDLLDDGNIVAEARIIGCVISPGNGSDQSTYRSELSGNLAVVIMVKNLCTYHNIVEGSVELACNGFSALNKAFSYVSILQIEDPNYDLIAAIKHWWLYSLLLWKIRHVKGHQDDHVEVQQLDRWSQLNVEMDLLAKVHINFAKSQHRHCSFIGEPWSLWIGGKKIVNNLADTLYEIAM